MAIILLKNAQVYAPAYQGKKDVLIIGEKIFKIADHIELPAQWLQDADVIDLENRTLVPGFMDKHVHITGAGGAGGPENRPPYLHLSAYIRGGITSVGGITGVDRVSRSPEDLLMRVKALKAEGIFAWMYIGGVHLPIPTITGSVHTDIVLIEEVLGSKIAISDHRCSVPTLQEIAKIASATRLGGMLSNKKGIVHIHMGEGKVLFDPLFEVVEETDIPITQFSTTHVNRARRVLDAGIEFALAGGRIDMSSVVSPALGIKGGIKSSKAVVEAVKAGVDPRLITVSSDGGSTIPKYNDAGELVGRGIAPLGIFDEFKALILEEGFEISKALPFFTSNVADELGLAEKGKIAEGADADILVLNSECDLEYVFARGKKLMVEGKLVRKGTFE
ncbi:MAG: beta-aspartyl-peptidase [bacterium]|jgi:beta-aspartyl-dipeptidase (metallo-type)